MQVLRPPRHWRCRCRRYRGRGRRPVTTIRSPAYIIIGLTVVVSVTFDLIGVAASMFITVMFTVGTIAFV
jgi:hypothetical protein